MPKRKPKKCNGTMYVTQLNGSEVIFTCSRCSQIDIYETDWNRYGNDCKPMSCNRWMFRNSYKEETLE